MSDPHTLLLVPPPGDTTLLADDPCGGRVPMWWATPDHLHEPTWTQPDEIDRVRRHVGEAPDMEYAVADAVAVAHEYVETHPDTRIVAGADGREVTP